MKLGVMAKVGAEPARAEPHASGRRALRVVEAAPALDAAVETPAAAFRLSRTPIEAPAPATLPAGEEELAAPQEDEAAPALLEPAAREALAEVVQLRAQAPVALASDRPPEPARALIEPLAAPVGAERVAPLRAAQAAAGPLEGTTAEIGPRLNALPPSLQAERYAELGPALDAALGAQAAAAARARPNPTAALPGASAPPPTPEIETPREVASTTEQIFDRTEPVLTSPQAPARAVIERTPLPSALPKGGLLANVAVLGRALGPAVLRPKIPTHIEQHPIPLEGAADPGQLDTIQEAAGDEARTALTRAQAPVQAIRPELIQPLALEQTVDTAPLPELAPLAATPTVEGMDQFAAYALSEPDRAAFDARLGPEMQAACVAAEADLARNETEHNIAQQTALANAETEGAAAQTEAEFARQGHVAGAREKLVHEQRSVLDQQQTAADDQLSELAAERNESASRIDQQLDSDRAAIDATYARGEFEAQEQIAQGATRSEATQAEASKQVEAESWWDWGIDTWQATVRSFADGLISIWEAVADGVRALLDRVIAQATRLVEGAVRFVKQVLTVYYAAWQELIQELLGGIFPEFAAELQRRIDELKALVFSLLDAAAELYLGTLRLIADTLVGALYAGLELYRAGVAGYLALWEAVQKGEWAEVGTVLLTALLLAVGIPPEEFFETFGKLDDVLEALAANPTVVVVNAIAALKLGFDQFGANFLGHFAAAAVEWLTGASGVQLPATFDFAGLFDVVRQVLGLTNGDLRRKAVKYLGEGAVTAAEKLYDAILEFVRDGWGGLWEHVKGELTSLVDDVVMAMGSWLVQKAILVVGRWIGGLIATAGLSAIVEGLIALWQFGKWVIDQFHQFWDIVKSTIDSVHEFVMGNIGPAAKTIEATLENLIPPAIDLVAKLLNIGDIPNKIENVVEGVRAAVDRAIDKVFFGLMKRLGLGEKGEGKGDGEATHLEDLTEEFSTPDKKTHTLYFRGEGSDAELIVESDPKTIAAIIKDGEFAGRPLTALTHHLIASDYHLLKAELAEPHISDKRVASLLGSIKVCLGTGVTADLHYPKGVRGDPVLIYWYKKEESYPRILGFSPTEMMEPWKVLPKNFPQAGSEVEFKARKRESPTFFTDELLGMLQAKDDPIVGNIRLRAGKDGMEGINALGPPTKDIYDIDHVRDLNLGGEDLHTNLWPIDSQKNRKNENQNQKVVVESQGNTESLSHSRFDNRYVVAVAYVEAEARRTASSELLKKEEARDLQNARADLVSLLKSSTERQGEPVARGERPIERVFTTFAGNKDDPYRIAWLKPKASYPKFSPLGMKEEFKIGSQPFKDNPRRQAWLHVREEALYNPVESKEPWEIKRTKGRAKADAVSDAITKDEKESRELLRVDPADPDAQKIESVDGKRLTRVDPTAYLAVDHVLDLNFSGENKLGNLWPLAANKNDAVNAVNNQWVACDSKAMKPEARKGIGGSKGVVRVNDLLQPRVLKVVEVRGIPGSKGEHGTTVNTPAGHFELLKLQK